MICETAMINVPEQYRVNKTIALKTVLSGIKKPADKKKLKSCLKSVCLTHQIQGETIPSFVDDRYRYEVIQFLEIQLDTFKKAESAATVLHKLFKPPCIIQFHDSVQGAVSFTDKRLSRQNDQEIVLGEVVVTPVQPLSFFQNPVSLWGKTMDFNAILNTSSKRGFYLEAMTKAFICGYTSLYSRMQEFLHTPVWYNSATVQALFEKLETLRRLTLQKGKAAQTKDKVALNQQIKAVMQELETMLTQLLNEQ
jgi:hypothetical protein